MTNNCSGQYDGKGLVFTVVCERWALNDIILSLYYNIRIDRNNFQNYSNIFNFLLIQVIYKLEEKMKAWKAT